MLIGGNGYVFALVILMHKYDWTERGLFYSSSNGIVTASGWLAVSPAIYFHRKIHEVLFIINFKEIKVCSSISLKVFHRHQIT